MVYRGKPSKSCRQCRQRDIKCDKRRESCGQCIRAHLICPGYVDLSRTIFSDETQSVVSKVTKARLRPRPSSYVEAPLTTCIEERAKKLFISQYVFCKTGRFPYMDHFWLARPNHAHLAMALRAVSLAYLSIELCSDGILRRAGQRYSLALRLTNAALRYPPSAKNNATLLTVFLLYLYEKLTRKSGHDFSGESMHLSGALTLLQLSGASQFDDAVRILLFRKISMSVLLKCIRDGEDIPPYLLSMRQSITVADQEGHLEELIARFAALQSSVRKGELMGCEIYAVVAQLDDALVKHCSRPPKWKFADAIAGNIAYKDIFVHLIEVTSTVL